MVKRKGLIVDFKLKKSRNQGCRYVHHKVQYCTNLQKKNNYKIPIVLHRNVFSVQCTLWFYTLWFKNAVSPGRNKIGS